MAPPELLGSDSESEGSDNPGPANRSHQSKDRLVVNKRYAKTFQARKEREDLRHLSREGISSSDSENESSEDEDGVLLTTRLDTDIAKTLNALRTKDARIYNPTVRFFDSEEDDNGDESSEEDTASNPHEKRKPMRYKDVVREQALAQMETEHNRENDEEEDDLTLPMPSSNSPHRLAYNQEQQAIRENFLKSFRKEEDTDDKDAGARSHDSDDDDLLVVKTKTNMDGQDTDEAAFAEEMEKLQQSSSSLSQNTVTDIQGAVENGDQFLLNYFSQRAWKDKDDESSASGSDNGDGYEDELLPMKDNNVSKDDEDDASLEHVEEADDFEARYNFRYEEAAAASTVSGAEFSLTSYARNSSGLDSSLRRVDTRRKEQREARKARKAAERKAKEEELKRLKNLKRKDMQRKLQQVQQVMGMITSPSKGDSASEHNNNSIDEAAILKLMEGDYDPEEFEKKMQETFGDQYYAQEDAEWKTDMDVRESLRKDEDGSLLVGQDGQAGDLYDNADDNDKDEPGESADEEDTRSEGSQLYDEDAGAFQSEETETELEKKLKSQMQEELYKLDYEDIVAGMPTRFKYRQVEANDYGLTTEEILLARDTTLKQYVSLKKMAPYREDGEFRAGSKRRRRFREMVQQQIDDELASAPADEEVREEISTDVNATESNKRKRRRVKKKTKSKDQNDLSADGKEDSSTSAAIGEAVAMPVREDNDAKPTTSKRRRRQKKTKPDTSDKAEQPISPLTGQNESGIGTSDETVPEATATSKESDTKSRKKDRKRKKRDRKDAHPNEKHGKKKKLSVEGISGSRLASYGL